MHEGNGQVAHRPEGAGGHSYMHVGTGPHTRRPDRDPYMHMGAGSDAHRPEGADGDSHMHVGTGLRRPQSCLGL